MFRKALCFLNRRASLMLLFLVPTLSTSLSASALDGLHSSRWQIVHLEESCILQQEIPRFGLARFIGIPAQSLRFQIRPDLPLDRPGVGTLWLEPPPWRNDLEAQSLGSVPLRAGPVLVTVGGADARAVYAGLEQGYSVTLKISPSLRSSGQGDFTVQPIRFLELLLEFRTCSGYFPPFDFVALDEWRIAFDLNSTRIDSRATLELRRIANQLLQNPETRLVIVGHADSQGDARYNQRLSMRRAESVRRVLEAEGLSRERLRLLGFGDTRPLRIEEDEEAWRANRRVDIWWIDGEDRPQ